MFKTCLLLILGWLPCLAQAMPKAELQIGTHRVQVEVAATPGVRERGLMFRQVLAENAGMLFIFEEAKPHCFWMKNTNIPLSIAFIDDDGQIVTLADMAPGTQSPHCPSKPVRYALEVNQGWFKSRAIAVGAKVQGIDKAAAAR